MAVRGWLSYSQPNALLQRVSIKCLTNETSLPVKRLLIRPSIVDTTNVPDDPQREMRVFSPSVVKTPGELVVLLGGIAFALQELKSIKGGRSGGAVRRCEVLSPCLVDGRFEGIYHWVGGPRNGSGSRFLEARRLLLSGKEKVKEIGVIQLSNMRKCRKLRRGYDDDGRRCHFITEDAGLKSA